MPRTARLSAADEVPVRPAATVMMVRDGDHPEVPLEVLMVRRNPRADFGGGAYVFPGGALDPADGGPAAEERCSGRDGVAACAALGLPDGGLAYWVAALRECFEESGLLLAVREDDGASLLSLADEPIARRFARHRADVNAGRRRFLDVCVEERLRLPLDRVHYFSHWITPVGRPRRYDTRFFLAAAPPDQAPAHDAEETIDDVWVRPADALARYQAGEIELVFPTVRTLEAIGRCTTVAELVAAAEAAAPGLAGAPPILPRLVPDGRGVRILLPGDPGYDEDDVAAAPAPARAPAPSVAAAPAAGASAAPSTSADARAAADAPSPAAGGGRGRGDVTPVRRPAPVPDAGVGPVPVPGRPDELAPGLVRLTAPNPGVMTGPGTNTYLVGTEGDLAVVDPGPDDAGHRRAILAAAAARGRVRWVLTTHTHPDHAPGAAPLAEVTGAEQVGYEARDGFVPDVAAGDGWVLAGPTFRLRAVHTPGHAGNHLCWLYEEQRILLSGDHVMQGATVVIRPPDGDMAAYLASLRRLLGADPSLGPLEAVAPGHGRLIGAPDRVIEGIVAHRLAREAVVADALAASGGGTVDELAALVYADVDAGLLPVARFSLWAHLRKLVADGRARALPAGAPARREPVVATAAPSGPPGAVDGPGAAAHEELTWRWEPVGDAG